nr:MAG TPA: hypothetical protein [Caudoviricetes sp.]
MQSDSQMRLKYHQVSVLNVKRLLIRISCIVVHVDTN